MNEISGNEKFVIASLRIAEKFVDEIGDAEFACVLVQLVGWRRKPVDPEALNEVWVPKRNV